MGVEVRVLVYAESRIRFNEMILDAKSKMAELNSIFSNYDERSEISQLANGSPNSAAVSESLWEVALLADQVFQQTQGAFDPTIGPLSKLWRMSRKRNRLPRPTSIESARKQVGWSRQVKMDPKRKHIALSDTGVQLDFGGLVKGYAASQLVVLFKRHGSCSVLVDVGGDISVGEPPPHTNGWVVAINSPDDSAANLRLSNISIATSGDAQQHLFKNGVRYSHLIDPRTGWALKNSHTVTVIGPNGALADAYASALSVMAPQEGIRFIDSVTNYEALVVTSGDDEEKHELRSSKFDQLARSESLTNPTPGLSDTLIDQKD